MEFLKLSQKCCLTSIDINIFVMICSLYSLYNCVHEVNFILGHPVLAHLNVKRISRFWANGLLKLPWWYLRWDRTPSCGVRKGLSRIDEKTSARWIKLIRSIIICRKKTSFADFVFLNWSPLTSRLLGSYRGRI